MKTASSENGLFNRIFDDVIEPYLAPKVKRGSLKAVKSYVSTVKVVREVAIGVLGASTTTAVLVTGLILLIVGVVGLLPITVEAMLITFIVLGVLMTMAAGIALYIATREKNWLEWSKANSLIAAATGEWQNSMIPPNPKAVMMGVDSNATSASASQVVEAEKSYDENRKLEAQRNVPAFPSHFSGINGGAAELPRPI